MNTALQEITPDSVLAALQGRIFGQLGLPLRDNNDQGVTP